MSKTKKRKTGKTFASSGIRTLKFWLLEIDPYRPLSRDVTHDELRIGRHVGGKTKKEQKKFLKKIRE